MSKTIIRVFLPLLLLAGIIDYADSASLLNTIDLSGDWRVRTQNDKAYDLKVPGSLESQIAGLRSYSGIARYWKQFPIPESWQGKQIMLRFGAVDWLADVKINGTDVGSHEGGYTPFEFDITAHVKVGGWNNLLVTVTDVTPDQPSGALVFDEIPHGRQGWYGPQSGIWQGVTLEALDPVAVAELRITPDIDRSVVRVDVALSRPSDSGELRLNVLGQGAVPRSTVIPLQSDRTKYSVEVGLDSPKLWEPEDPCLYRVQTRFRFGDRLTDAEETEFGMRKIEVKDNRIHLNNRPLFVRGVQDEDYYPLTEYTAPSDQFLRSQFQRAKQMGINLIRCQAKIPDPRYLQWANRVGLIVWYEMPGFGNLNDRSRARAAVLLKEALGRDYNHPSLCMISLMGDGWGIDASNPEHRSWQKVMYENAKTLDPTRLVIDNSSSETLHMKTDIEDLNHKVPLAGDRKDFAAWVSDIVKTPGASFSTLGDAVRRGWEPLIISDAGNWGLPKISGLRKTYNGDPWWFTSGSGASRADGVDQRFQDQGLDGVFGSLDALAEACQWRQWENIKHRIESIRRHGEFGGYVLGEFADVNWEANGLLDADRNPKVFHDKVKCVQADDVVIAESETFNFEAGRNASVGILVSHMAPGELEDCTVRWRLEGTDQGGQIRGVSVPGMQVRQVGTVSLPIPSAAEAGKAVLSMSLLSPSGTALTQNYQDVGILPAPIASAGARIAVWDPRGGLKALAARLTSCGYTVSATLEGSAVALTDTLDDSVRSFAAGGGRVILVARDSDSIPRLAGTDLTVVSTDDTERWSDWTRCFMWMRKAGPMRRAELISGIGSEYSSLRPKSVMVGIDMAKHRSDVFAGMFVGWLRNPAVIAAQFRAGDGKVFATTLDLFSADGEDPAAVFLLNEIISYVSGSEFRPSMAIDLRRASAAPEIEFGAGDWRITTTTPEEQWTEVGFDDTAWGVRTGALVTGGKPGAAVRTIWKPADLWMRKTGEIGGPVARADIIYVSDEPFEAYINGTSVIRADAPASRLQRHTLSASQLRLLKEGQNVLAVRAHQKPGGNRPDVGLAYSLR